MFFSYLRFFLSFQLILFSLRQVSRHQLKHFHNFTNLKQEHKPSHFVPSYLWQEWGFIHKAFWNGLSIIGISTELVNVPVMVLEKKTDKKGAEIGCLAPCYLCERTKGRCTVGSGGGKGGKLSNRICHYTIFFFIMVITGDLKYLSPYVNFFRCSNSSVLKWNPFFSFYFWTLGLTNTRVLHSIELFNQQSEQYTPSSFMYQS